MKKIICATIMLALPCLADDAIYFNTKTGAIKQSATGVGAVTKPYDFNAVSVIGIDTTTTFGNQLIEGGGVAWIDNLNFTVSSARFRINGIEYVSPQTNITLEAADSSNDRIDVFALQGAGGTLGEAVAITGIPGGPPLEPQIDPVTQLRLTSVIIPANSTEPVITNEDIYHENTEWTTATNTVNFLVASINNPHLGTKDVEGTNLSSGNNLSFTRPSGTVDLSTFQSLIFYVRSKGAWATTKGISISWLNGSTTVGTAVAFRNGTFGFDSSNTTTYQQIVIPAASFNTTTSAVNKLLMTVQGTGANIPGLYLDDIILQGNIVNPPPGGGDFSTNVSSVTSGDFVQFTGTSGKLGTDGGLSRSIDGTFAANSDTLLPSQKAVKTYVDGVAGGGAPSTVDYLVGTASGGLSAEIVVGTSPGGELGGTWASPTIDDNVTVTGWNLGASTATTPTGGDNDTSLATTAFVQGEISGFLTSSSISDTAYDATTWDGVTTIAPSKNAVRDKFESLAGTIPTISDTAFASTWDAVTTIAPSKNAVYDEIHAFDTDDDGKVNVLDVVSSAGFLAVTSGGVPVEGRTLTEGLAIDITNPTGAAGAPTFAFDPTELTGSRTWGDASTDTIVWTFDRATGTDSTITSLSGGIGVQSLTDAALTSGRVTFAGASGILTDDADLTFATDTLTATKLAITTIAYPVSNDGAPLGDTTHQFSDLFLAEGGVINFDNGDATITQVGDVVTVAGAVLKNSTVGTAADSVATIDGTQTLTNKRVNPRALDSNAPSSPVAPDSDSYDFIDYRGINAALTINAPTGTPVSGQKLIIRFKDDGTARALTWQTGSSGQFRASSDLALPTTTVLSKTIYCGFIYNATDSRWDLLAKLDNF